MKKTGHHIKAGALSSVMVVSTLMLLGMMALIAWWDTDILFFSGTMRLKMQNTDMRSAYLLYSAHPDDFKQKENEIMIFRDRPSSKVKIEPEPWGLYEAVTVTVGKTEFSRTKLLGLRAPSVYGAGFFHPENLRSVTLAGTTNILTGAYLPRNGFIYGQLYSNFFNGKKVESSQMKPAPTSFPVPPTEITARIDSLFSMGISDRELPAKATVPFRKSRILICSAPDTISHCELTGKIIIMGENLKIDSTCHFNDIAIICSNLVIGKGFEGSMQVFARDSVRVESNARLLYPSGIYSTRWAEVSDNAQINGYVVVNPAEDIGVTHPNYISGRRSVVRGLVYVNGNAQLQGIVSGSVFIKEAMYYAPTGYYRGMICDFTLLENTDVAYPIWLDNGKRRAAKWLK